MTTRRHIHTYLNIILEHIHSDTGYKRECINRVCNNAGMFVLYAAYSIFACV